MRTTQIFQLQAIKDISTLKPLAAQVLELENPTKKKIEQLKTAWAKQYRIKLPLNSEILKAATQEQKEKLRKVLLTKPNRTLSGVSVIAVMPAPLPCIWGSCTYCPKGEDAPQAYTGYEPTTMRARMNRYSAYRQVTNRLSQLNNIGHSTDKNELILMGGTFPALNWDYQKSFVAKSFAAFNNFESGSEEKEFFDLKEEQTKNETAKNRVVGLTIETRPDHCPINKILELGATRVELGVQSVYQKILKKINRGHGINEVYKATAELKDAGLKVLYHIMPGLPGSTFESDLEMFRTLFSDDRLKPDMFKIYPCLVIKNTELHKQWKNQQYEPVSDEYMADLLKEVYKICPPWVRIMRVQRDIPAPLIEAGPKKSNIREEVLKELKKKNFPSQEIRYREAGRIGKLGKLSINVTEYEASGGKEYLIAAEDENKTLAGFLRLRLPSNTNIRKEITSKTALVRELHVYGKAIPIGAEGEVQHIGIGKRLLKKAEELALSKGKNKIVIISGVGVREYYYKLGYELDGVYVSKVI